MQISSRVRSLKPSSTVAVTARAKELRAQGHDVLSFAAGEPDFDTPDRIKRAAIRALELGDTKYASPPGDPETRKVIARKLQEENAIPNVAADHVVVTNGGKHALYLLLQALIDPPAPGEPPLEAILPTPAWVSYAPQVELAGGRVVEVPAGPEQGYKITPAQLREAITPRSRVLIFNSPCNPTGVAYTPDEIRALARVVEEAAAGVAPDLIVITDEIYEKIIYAGATHLSMGSVPGVAERCVTVNGLSKAFSMTGWRLGYLAGSGGWGREIAAAVSKLQGQTTTSVATFFLPAVRTALLECADEVERMRNAFARRAELIHSRLTSMPDLVCPRPTGAFYAFVDVSAHFGKSSPGGLRIQSALDFASALLDEQRVAAVPGEDFLGCGDRCVRLSFACSEEQIEQGMERLGEFIASLR